MNQIGHLASGVLDYDFSFITDPAEREPELLTISGSLSGKIGDLNTLIHQSFHFTGDDGELDPELQNEESAILRKLYMRDWCRKQGQKVLRGIYLDSVGGSSASGASVDWTELREGDTVIRRSSTSSASSATSRLDMQKAFKDMAKEIDEELKELVTRYNVYGAQPRQIISEDCPISVEATTESGNY